MTQHPDPLGHVRKNSLKVLMNSIIAIRSTGPNTLVAQACYWLVHDAYRADDQQMRREAAMQIEGALKMFQAGSLPGSEDLCGVLKEALGEAQDILRCENASDIRRNVERIERITITLQRTFRSGD